jgi:TIR domain
VPPGKRRSRKRVFLSHSFTDKWVADHIAADLAKREIDCFLAEKDVNTGAEIVASVLNELRSSDALLILLSPASVKSDWVQAEVVMAVTLGIPFAPILLHVGTNDVPRLLAPYNARDINAIERYYGELTGGTRIGSAAKALKRSAARRVQRQRPKTTKFSVGDSVRIVNTAQQDVYRPGKGSLNWVSPYMDAFSGQTAKIVEVDRDGSAKLDIDEAVFWWAFEWLERVRR